MEFQFENMSAFFDMGGYAFFVWASFICTLLCMVAVLFHSLLMSKKIKQGVLKETARAQRIMAAREARANGKRKQKATLDAPNSTHSTNSDNAEVDNEPKT